MTGPGHLMAAEVAEIPSVIERQLRDNLDAYLALGRDWAAAPPSFFATCARGTSDQAALFFKYLTEIGTGIPVASIGPSLGSLFDGPLRMPGAALLAISQSGASPDLVALTRKASAGGARSVALLNTIPSPLSQAADQALPLSAGPEQAVAATKSFVASLVAAAAIHAGHADDALLLDELTSLPERLRAMDQTAQELYPLSGARRLFCLGRGLGLALAGEAALKFKETCLLAAEGASTAEFRHGPLALADADTAALVFQLDDPTRPGTLALVTTLRERGTTVVTIGAGGADIRIPDLHHPAAQAIAAITAFYQLVGPLSVDLGLDPDTPPHLVKATLTE